MSVLIDTVDFYWLLSAMGSLLVNSLSVRALHTAGLDVDRVGVLMRGVD